MQPDLFPVIPACDHTPIFFPDPNATRKMLRGVIAHLREATFMPYDANALASWKTVVPQSARALPKDDAAALIAEFDAEIARLADRKPNAHHMGINQEAQSLAVRTGLRWQACKQWMQHVGIRSVPDLKTHYPNVEHADCMTRAADEIAEFICR
jgi:hypothetical protein